MQNTKLSSLYKSHDEEDDEGGVFLDETDIIDGYFVDDEDLPDAYDHADGDDGKDCLPEADDHAYGDDDEEDLTEADDDSMHGDVDDVADDSLHKFTGHTDEIFTVSCSPTDPTLAATGGGDDKAFLWKIGQGDWVSELRGHTDSVSRLAFSRDGQLLATGGLDGIVQIWDIASSRNHKFKLEGPNNGGPEDNDIEWVRWHPKEHVVLAGSKNRQVWMWDADKGSYLGLFQGHSESVTCGDFTPDGRLFCTGSYDGSLRIWEPSISSQSKAVKDLGELTCLALSSDSTFAITGSMDGPVHVVNIPTCRKVSSLVSHSDSVECSDISNMSVECVGISPNSCWAASGGLDDKLIIWDLVSSMRRATCEHGDGVICLVWLGESRYVATGCKDGKVRLWDTLSGYCVRTFSGHSKTIHSLSVSANQRYIVSGSSDRTARVFEIV